MDATDVFNDELLERIRSRAGDYDRENRFFSEDLKELQTAGYLSAAVPVEFGGLGLSLAELTRAQRELAKASPATALGVNMHLVWSAVAKLLYERGDSSLSFVFDDTVAGEIYAFGVSEPKNDAVLMDANTTATPDGDNYLLDGMKVFTTMSPVWTRLGVHARSGDDLIYGFIRRSPDIAVRSPEEASAGLETGEISHPGTWNPLGMRATQSWNTVLSGVRLRREDVATVTTPFNGEDPVVWSIFCAFSVLTASVYAGIADRALEIAREGANREHTFVDGTVAPLVTDPDVASKMTQSVLEHRLSVASLDMLAQDADALVDRADWFLALGAMRNRVTDEAREAVTEALRISGTQGFQADSELARMYRDVLAGLFHPTSARSLAGTVRNTLLDQ
jgi:alkylation response protein AidB-like acyl-CoA dehydrogenase